jgi:hypothetical protein
LGDGVSLKEVFMGVATNTVYLDNIELMIWVWSSDALELLTDIKQFDQAQTLHISFNSLIERALLLKEQSSGEG